MLLANLRDDGVPLLSHADSFEAVSGVLKMRQGRIVISIPPTRHLRVW
jgi:hypothetical protein